MSLSCVGPKGSFEERWIVYAQLRDNVWDHVEGGKRSEAFAELCTMGEALGGESVTVSARAVRIPAQKVVDLLAKPVSDLAIGVRTKNAFRILFAQAAEGPDTTLARDSGETVPFSRDDPKTRGDVFDLAPHLIAITEDASQDDLVEIIDM